MSASRDNLMNQAINALPFELHIPRYQFCGPGTWLTKRLARDDTGINPLDAMCRKHDIVYSRSNDFTDRHAANKVLANKTRTRHHQRFDSELESRRCCRLPTAMKAKTKIGMSMKPKKKTTKKKTTKKRILSTWHKRRITFSANVGRVNSRKLQRHDRAMEQGRRLYFSLYKRGQDVAAKKKNAKRTIKMPTGAIRHTCSRDVCAYFRDVFMRNALPTSGALKRKRHRESRRCDRTRYSLGSLCEEE